MAAEELTTRILRDDADCTSWWQETMEVSKEDFTLSERRTLKIQYIATPKVVICADLTDIYALVCRTTDNTIEFYPKNPWRFSVADIETILHDGRVFLIRNPTVEQELIGYDYMTPEMVLGKQVSTHDPQAGVESIKTSLGNPDLEFDVKEQLEEFLEQAIIRANDYRLTQWEDAIVGRGRIIFDKLNTAFRLGREQDTILDILAQFQIQFLIMFQYVNYAFVKKIPNPAKKARVSDMLNGMIESARSDVNTWMFNKINENEYEESLEFESDESEVEIDSEDNIYNEEVHQKHSSIRNTTDMMRSLLNGLISRISENDLKI